MSNPPLPLIHLRISVTFGGQVRFSPPPPPATVASI